MLLNVDNLVVVRISGEVALGYYVLAFNVSSWPMSAIGTAIRSVSLPAFSRTTNAREDFGEEGSDPILLSATALSWAAAVPAGVMLAVLSASLIRLLYGNQWDPSAPVLVALGLFGAQRVVFDIWATYLMARGSVRAVFWIQALWIITLVPVLIVATRAFGVVGAGWAHVGVGLLVIFPAYMWALSRVGANLGALARTLWPPVVAIVPAWIVAHAIASRFKPLPVAALSLGSIAGLILYFAALHRWLQGLRRSAEHRPPDIDQRTGTPAGTGTD